MSGFVDVAQLNVRGGDGGAGCVSFRREAHVARGGPDGGDGGRGGDVWLVADRNVASLLAFRDHPHRRATNGTHGQGKKRHGGGGDDVDVHVPEGTVVTDREGSVLADLVQHGDRWLAARGGVGGQGNARFLANNRRAPAFAEQGELGEERWLGLELKLMADVALVGFPNVGKSTLISRISAAKPKIADYPFTTLEPNLGVVSMDDGIEYVVADVPGLIEGASEGRGLGHQFLRHVERARVLCLLLDLSPFATHPPTDQHEILLRELGAHRRELLDRPRLVVGSRSDLREDTDAPLPAGVELEVAAVTGQGVDRLRGRLADLVQTARQAEPVSDAIVVHRPEPDGIRVERIGERAWQVVGRPAERAVALNDLTRPDTLAFVQQRLRRLGVDRALARAGVRGGDIVTIGAFEFDFEPDEQVHEWT
ncbi:MAG TPA: GTPase ObgE [Acidimicrobiales bacterium]|nr:GTPase ObgE [Acidimicrobiales bacterium]